MDHPEPRVSLPGFGLPVDTLPIWDRDSGTTQQRFPHILADFCPGEGVTFRERRMLKFIDQISDEPAWDRKVFDDTLVSKWRSEACRHDENLRDENLSEAMFDYCIKELRDKAETYREKGLVCVMDVIDTVKSDVCVPESLRAALIQGIRPLEHAYSRLKKRHITSDDAISNILDPSMYPLVYGRSRALAFGHVPLKGCAEFCGMGETVPEWGEEDLEGSLLNGGVERFLKPWGSYQWLPAQINFTGDESRPTIASYVNNLYPEEHEELYGVLEQFVDKAIPLWDECLSWSHDRTRITRGGKETSDYAWEVPVWPLRADHPDHQLDQEAPDYNTVQDNEAWAHRHGLGDEWLAFFQSNLRLKPMEPREFTPSRDTPPSPGARRVDLKSDFKSSGLQVIFKITTINLSPENPHYDDHWHLEGSLNEHICATALYYYDSDNISPSSLVFRTCMDTTNTWVEHHPSDDSHLSVHYGVEDGGPTDQALGCVGTPRGRLLALPSTLPHCRGDGGPPRLRLADPARPGRLGVLAMHLVDPHVPVLSTARVPPQRRDWWARAVREGVPRLRALPREVFEMIVRHVEGGVPLGTGEALAVRRGLEHERMDMEWGMVVMMEDESFDFGGVW